MSTVAEPHVDLDALQARMCDGKTAMGAKAARECAQRMRSEGHRVSPYRCCFCEDWHVGHVPSMTTVELIADAIRQRSQET